jgi:hypothetical protein
MSPMFLRTWYQRRHFIRRRGLLESTDGGLASGGEAGAVQVVGFLQRALQALGHLLHGFFDGCTWPGRAYHHGAEVDLRVLVSAQVHKRQRTGYHREDHQEDYQ